MNKTLLAASLVIGLATVSANSWAGLESGIDAYNGGDYAKALHELQPLAEHGTGEAQRYLALMYANGQGVPKDETVAVVWYTNAAIGGNSSAQLSLGDMYQFGKGVKADGVIGAYWHWRAANGFNAVAKSNFEKSLDKSSGVLNAAGKPESAHETGCSAPAFQANAAHFGEDSTLDLGFLLDAGGKVVDTVVIRSSSWPLLDKLARESFSNCSFPLQKQDGKAVPAVIRASFSWKVK